MKTNLTLISLCLLFPILCHATTWDEPWMEVVIKDADAFVKADVTENRPDGFKATLLKHLAGENVSKEFKVTGFSLLHFSSYSAKEDVFRFNPDLDYYLFLKKGKKEGQYLIATPTTGWAIIISEGVNATYRHSYHQALVPEDVYEESMSAIFKKLHNEKVKSDTIIAYIEKHLSKEPALPSKSDGNEDVLKKFFLQHVALELFRYFGTAEKIDLIDPYLSTDDYHVQISAVRAIGRINTNDSKRRLIEFIESDRVGFAKVMAVWGLERLNAVEYKGHLNAFLKNGKDEETGFGNSIMDPRVGTHFPRSVKAAVEDLLIKWKNESSNKAIELVPRDAEAYRQRGVAYAQGKGQYDQAISDFNKAIELDPKLAMAYNNRGLAYALGKGQYDRAISDYNKAIDLDPKLASACYVSILLNLDIPL